MKAEIKQLFEMLTRQFLKDFLPNRTQNARGLLAPAFPNPPILRFYHPGIITSRPTSRKSCLISCPDTLTRDTMIPDTRSARVPPILLANHPILHASHPILRSSHPIQRNNHPRFSAWGLILQALCTVHCSLLEGVKVAGWQGVRASKRGTGIPACHPITVHCLPPNPNFHQGGA